ncbi:hypothetical protein TRFO_03536 [Tritrichomonas foetus]|uniref:Uncharacterized protein n=1 Tax=Tritrichomonas foetus TaxID=1144522 RepID=A0A1J4KP76_9EUKA|nr:hypothetical protein TRFO_03536 [Tritrichomonas foetus]|eukprot:OHT13095.1 hypothetical protein TRFO_03536 [Tritrichomonas foetus]
MLAQREDFLLNQDFTPLKIMNAISPQYFKDSLSTETAQIIESKNNLKKVTTFVLHESEKLETINNIILFVKPRQPVRKSRGFLFISSSKELSAFWLNSGTEEKIGKFKSSSFNDKTNIIKFDLLNNNERRKFRIKSNITESLISSIFDFIDMTKTPTDPYVDFLISFSHLPSENLDIYPPFKESFRSLFISIDLGFVAKLQQMNLSSLYLNELGSILFTLFSKNDMIFYLINYLIYVEIESCVNPSDLFLRDSLLSSILLKWIQTSCFDFYEKLISYLKNNCYANDSVNKFLSDFLIVLNLKENFPISLLVIMANVFNEISRKFENQENTPYFGITRLFIAKGIRDLLKDLSPDDIKLNSINDMLEFTVNARYDEKLTVKLKSMIHEIVTQNYHDISSPKMNVEEVNKQYRNLLSFMINNSENLEKLMKKCNNFNLKPPLEVFIHNLWNYTK